MANTTTLHPVAPTDLPTLFEHQRDPEATAMAAFRPRDHDAFDAHWRRILADPTVIARTILFDGEIAGNIVC